MTQGGGTERSFNSFQFLFGFLRGVSGKIIHGGYLRGASVKRIQFGLLHRVSVKRTQFGCDRGVYVKRRHFGFLRGIPVKGNPFRIHPCSFCQEQSRIVNLKRIKGEDVQRSSQIHVNPEMEASAAGSNLGKRERMCKSRRKSA